jgi:hypothetical protein
MEQKIRRSIINIQNWFNSPILSDIKIYSAKSNNSSPVFHCHQIVIYLNSPNLLQALKNNKVGDKDDHVYIIEELLDKPHETELFLKSLYEPSVLGKTEHIITKGLLAPILEKFDVANKLSNFPVELIPTVNSETPFGDFKLKIAGHANYFNCSKLILASSCEYFRGLFSSEMVDKDSCEMEIKSPSLEPNDIAANMDLFIESLYLGRLTQTPLGQRKTLMVLLILSEQFLTGLRNNLKNTVMSDVNIRHGCEVIHYLIHYNRDVMLNDATGFLFYNVSLMSKEANFSMLPKEYLESISMNDKNIVQACLMSSKDSATRNALTLIMAKVGPNSPIKLQFVDSKGNTALHLAAIEPKPKTMKYLLEQGLNSQLEVENAEGKTPIEAALSKYQSTNVSKKVQRCVSILLLYNAKVRRRETNYEQLIKCAGAFPDFDASRRILKRILEETVRTDFEEAFANGLTEALCANNRKMTQYFLARRKVKATFMVVVLKTRQVTYRKELMRWSAVPSDQFKRTEISSKDAHTITIDQVDYDARGATIGEETIADDNSGHEFEENHLIFTLANGMVFIFVSQPESAILNLLNFYTREQEPDSDEEEEKEHDRIIHQISPRHSVSNNNSHGSNNSNNSIDQISMILLQGIQAASNIKEKKKKK